MKKGLIFAGLGLGLLGFGLYKYFSIQAELLKNYTYKIIGIKPIKITASEFVVDIKIRFTNKSNIEAKIKKLYLDIYVEGQKAGFIQDTREFIIPANGSSDIDLRFSFNPKQVIPNILSVIISGISRKDVSFRIEGIADVQSGFIKKPIKIQFEDVISSYIKK